MNYLTVKEFIAALNKSRGLELTPQALRMACFRGEIKGAYRSYRTNKPIWLIPEEALERCKVRVTITWE